MHVTGVEHSSCLCVRGRNGEANLTQQNPQVSKERILCGGLGKVIRDDQMWGSREAGCASSNMWHTKDRKGGSRVLKER